MCGSVGERMLSLTLPIYESLAPQLNLSIVSTGDANSIGLVTVFI